MQNTVSLNGLFADYTAGLLEKKKLEGEIFKTIKDNMLRFPNWDISDNDEYLSWLYPRINRAIAAYRETGSTFEKYIGSLVRMTAKEYRSRKARANMAERAALTTMLSDMYACEDAPDYACFEKEDRLDAIQPRQLLILILKCCVYVSDDFISRATSLLGIRPEELDRMVTHLRKFREKRERSNASLREKANFQFYRCIYYEKRLSLMPENSIAAQRIRTRLERGRVRLVKLRERLAKRIPGPPNCEIAKLLGLSKGTIDAVLYRLRTLAIKEMNGKNNDILLN